ncbi:GDSL-type esterase/lipase family protein [Nonomuraea rubra]|uniref:GDSL-type esterase/lipase family protein n=1 Tax=Nonomuraea rubra TaxID=46180 RepID=UPI00361FA41D
MKRPIVITISLLLAAALCAAGTVAYLTFLRPADHPPADACATPATGPRVVAAGASMTQGSLGADWVASLRASFPTYEFVNAGNNGDTTADLLNRVDTDIVACRPAAVTLLIGTNDVRNGVPWTSTAPTFARSWTASRAAPAPASPSCPCPRSART